MGFLSWELGIVVALGFFIVFTIERWLGDLLRQFVILQHKIDLVFKHLGIEYVVPPIGSLSANV